jgi:hypothetical protein
MKSDSFSVHINFEFNEPFTTEELQAAIGRAFGTRAFGLQGKYTISAAIPTDMIKPGKLPAVIGPMGVVQDPPK